MATILGTLGCYTGVADSAARCKSADSGCGGHLKSNSVSVTTLSRTPARHLRGRRRRRGHVAAATINDDVVPECCTDAQDMQGASQGPPLQISGSLKDTTRRHPRGRPSGTVRLSIAEPPSGNVISAAHELSLWRKEHPQEGVRQFQRSEWEREKAGLAQEAAALRQKIQSVQDQLCRIHLGGQLITPPPINDPQLPSSGVLPTPKKALVSLQPQQSPQPRMYRIRDEGRASKAATRSDSGEVGPAWERRRRVENVANQVLGAIVQKLRIK